MAAPAHQMLPYGHTLHYQGWSPARSAAVDKFAASSLIKSSAYLQARQETLIADAIRWQHLAAGRSCEVLRSMTASWYVAVSSHDLAFCGTSLVWL